jgi:hypothetical protein
VVDIIVAERKRCTSNQYYYFDTSNNATITTNRIFVKRRRIRWIMIVREYIIMQQQRIYLDTISASLKNRTFGNIIHYCTMTNPPTRGWSCPYCRWGEKFKQWWSGWMIDDVLACCAFNRWLRNTTINHSWGDEWKRTDSSQCDWDVLYHSLASENKIGDMRGH